MGAAVAAFDLPSLQLARDHDRSRSGAPACLGVGAVYDGGYLYAYASQRRTCAFCFAGDIYVARVPESQIAGAERVAVPIGLELGRRPRTRRRRY